VALRYPDIEQGLETIGIFRFFYVRTGNDKSQIAQHLGDAAHTYAAYADKMDPFDVSKHISLPCGQLLDHIHSLLRGIGPRHLSCSRAHRNQSLVIVRQLAYLVREAIGTQV